MNTDPMRWDGWGRESSRVEIAPGDPTWTWLARELGVASLPSTPSRNPADIAMPASRLDAADKTRFSAIVGAQHISDTPRDRLIHGLGRSYYDLIRLREGHIDSAPDLIVLPAKTDDVLAVLALAAERDCAVIPFGGGTSVVGGISSNRGTHRAVIVVDLCRMSRVTEIDSNALLASAEAGLRGPALERELQKNALTLGHYPQSFEFSTLGGWIAHRGAGQASNAFGRPEDWLAGARLATPRGLLEIKSSPASSAGPDFRELLIGSEGAFGIITEATFRVRRVPESQIYLGFLFRNFESGAETIRRAVQKGLPVAMLRLSDAEETRFYRGYGAAAHSRAGDMLATLYLRGRGFRDEACAMIAGFEDDRTVVNASRGQFSRLAREAGAIALGEGPGRRWQNGRFHAPYLRDVLMERGVGVDTFETATDWSNLNSLYNAVRSALATSISASLPSSSRGIVMCHISHSYPDGASLYFTCIFPRAEGDEIGQWRSIKTSATDAILANGGTLSHHHGVGEDHLAWMKKEKGVLGLDVLRAIKLALDPTMALNPGKLIP